MNVKVKIIHPTNDSNVEMELPDNILLEDVFSQLIESGFLSDDYLYSGILKNTEKRQESIWLDDNKTVEENGIKDNDIIQIKCTTAGQCAAADGSGFEIVQVWNTIYPYLDQLGTIVGLTGAAIGVGSWMKRRLGDTYTPKQFIEIITDRKIWNVHELALRLGITEDESRDLLKGLGYKWNENCSRFWKTNKTVEIIEKIKNAATEDD